MFAIDEEIGELIIPTEYQAKVKSWLNNDEELYSQIKRQVFEFITTTKILNIITYKRLLLNRK
jgi:hypothetical protein